MTKDKDEEKRVKKYAYLKRGKEGGACRCNVKYPYRRLCEVLVADEKLGAIWALQRERMRVSIRCSVFGQRMREIV
jgi:hypothetical protein